MASCASSMMAWAMTTFSVRKNFKVSCTASSWVLLMRPWASLRMSTLRLFTLGRHDEVERPVAHLLAHARLPKALHGLRHGRVGRKKKILAVVIVSLSADLYVLAMIAMVLIAVDVLIILIHNCIFFYPQMEGHKRCIVLF